MNRTALAVAALLLLAMPSGLAQAPALPNLLPEALVATVDEALPSNVRDVPASLGSARYEQNLGQWNPDILFRADGDGFVALLTPRGMVLVQADSSQAPVDQDSPKSPVSTWSTHMELVGGNTAALVSTGTPAASYSNYFIGNEPSKWRTNVPSFNQVLVEDVYPGIDLLYHGESSVKYDFIVHPGADPSVIQQRFQNADATTAGDGSLVLSTPLGALNLGRPDTYQQDGQAVDNAYEVTGDVVSFAVGSYDATQDLVIDPLMYSTYLGGGFDDRAKDVALDAAGNAYVTGYTYSSDFDTLNPQQASNEGNPDVFVSKFSPTGGLVYSTYLGGSNLDYGWGLAVDSAGNAYITGLTYSLDFDVLAAYQATNAGGTNGAKDAFVTRLTATGMLTFSTYLGGSGDEEGFAVAVDSSGSAYVTGFTASADFDLLTPYQSTRQSGRDAFVTKFTSAGVLAYSTYLGGNDYDYGKGIAVDSSGSAYIAGYTVSSVFPTMTPYQASKGGGLYDAFLTKLTPTGNALVYSTYLGGSSDEQALAVAVDSAGSAYVTGYTYSSDFDRLNAYQSTCNSEAFVSKFTATGGLSYSTCLGGGNEDIGYGIAVDSGGSAYVSGVTLSTDFPTLTPNQANNAGGRDAFVTKFSLTGGLAYSTYLGGSSDDSAYGVAVDSAGNAYLAGTTASTNFPVANAYQPSSAGYDDAFVAKLNSPPGTPASLAASCGSPHGISLTWTAPANGGSPITQYNVYRSSDGIAYAFVASSVTTSYTDVPPWSTTAYSYKVSAVNSNSEGTQSSPVSRVTCDSQAPTFNGPTTTNLGWRNAIPQLSGATWQDGYSGLISATYTMGTASGLSNVRSSTSIPTQPTPGQAYSPSWTPASATQGQNYVNVVVTDRAGLSTTTNGVYQFGYDTQAPTASGATYTTPWVNTSPSLANVCFLDVNSGLATNSARYWVGSTPGGTNYQTATLMSQQPQNGYTTSWCPTLQVPVASLRQGLNYVTIEIKDTLGQTATVNAYVIQYDTQGDALTGLLAKTGAGGAVIPMDVWQNDNTPRFEWNPAAGTSPIAGYSTSLATSASPAPDSSIETANAYQDASLTDGTWYFRVRAVDSSGNPGAPTSPYAVKVDATLPSAPSITSSTHADSARYYNASMATFSWSATDAMSGVDGYSYDLVSGGATGSPDTVKDAEENTLGATFSNIGTFGTWTLRVRAVDNAGNWGPTAYKVIHIDTVQPTFTFAQPGVNALPTDLLQVRYNDNDGGLDNSFSPATLVDPSKVKLFVDGQDVISMWSAVCPPTGTVCYLRVTSSGIDYKPLVPWQDGPHAVFVQIQDTVEGANRNSLSWTFVVNAGSPADQDGDRIPDETEGQICSREVAKMAIALTSDLGHACIDGNYRPPNQAGTFPVPYDVAAGPDADGDGFPSVVTVRTLQVTVSPFTLSVVSVGPGADLVIPVDGTHDNDPNYPVTSEYTTQPLPLAVVLGPDEDNDGVPHTVAIAEARLVIDRRSPTPVRMESEGGTSYTVDSNDQDPNVPAPSIITVPYAIPTGRSTGPDNDGDGVPQWESVTTSYVTIDRRQANPLTFQNGAPVTVQLDTRDDDPNYPAVTQTTLSVPMGVAFTADTDGDGLPGAVDVTWFDVHVDRRQQVPVTTGTHRAQFSEVDTDDGSRNDPVPYDQFDSDGDGIPQAAEMALCLVEDQRTPTDGTCSGSDYTAPRL